MEAVWDGSTMVTVSSKSSSWLLATENTCCSGGATMWHDGEFTGMAVAVAAVVVVVGERYVFGPG